MERAPETPLARLRRELEMTWDELAERLETPCDELRKYGCGSRVPSPIKAERLERLIFDSTGHKIDRAELIWPGRGRAA